MDFKPGYRGFVAFSEAIGESLEPYQLRIARAFFGKARRIAAILPKGNFKTHLAALIGVHNLLTVPGAEVVIGAPSRRQAEICLDRMKGFCRRPLLEPLITIRHWQLRNEETHGLLDVVSADGQRVHGFSPTLMIGDEVWAWKERTELLEAMESGLMKRPEAKMLLISTAAARLDTPLGRLRTQALAQPDVTRRGVVLEAKGDLHWLEWSLPDEHELTDWRRVKQCNPAEYITRPALRLQYQALPEPAFAQFHANRWGVGEGMWLPPGAWSACAGDAYIEEGEEVFLGVDIGGSRANTAIAIVAKAEDRLRVQIKIWEGDEAVLDAVAYLRELARVYTIREVAFDPWRFRSEALRLEGDGLRMVEFPQSTSRMVPASAQLYDLVMERKIVHGNDPDLNRHVANAIAKATPRGWRIATEGEPIDALIAILMAVERALAPAPEPVRLLGFV